MIIQQTRNINNLEKLQRILEELKTKKVIIGIFGANDSHILMIARVQEFGCDIQVTEKMRAYLHHRGLHLRKETTSIHIPERSFIRRTPQERQSEIDNVIKEGLNRLLTFEIDVTGFYNLVGQALVGITQEVLTSGSYEPNHPFTIEQKGGKSTPLINTGRLRESITWKVE